MKRIVPIFLFALLSVLSEAQAQDHMLHLIDPDHTMHQVGSSNFGVFRIRAPRSRLGYADTPLYHHIKIDDNISYLFDREGTFHYFGEIKQSSSGKFYPSGQGIDRTVERNAETGETAIRYSVGPWKRGSRHGKFLVKLPNGSYCTETWKWDRRKNISWAAPPADEVARMEDAVTRLENLLKLTAY